MCFLRKRRRRRAEAGHAPTRQRCVIGHTHTHIVHAVCFVAPAFVLCVRASSTLHSVMTDDFTEWRGSPPSFCRRHPVAWRAQISSRYRRPRGRADMVLKVLLRGVGRRAAAAPRNSSVFLHFNRRWERGRNERGVRERKRGGEEGQGKWEGGRGKVRRED